MEEEYKDSELSLCQIFQIEAGENKRDMADYYFGFIFTQGATRTTGTIFLICKQVLSRSNRSKCPKLNMYIVGIDIAKRFQFS